MPARALRQKTLAENLHLYAEISNHKLVLVPITFTPIELLGKECSTQVGRVARLLDKPDIH